MLRVIGLDFQSLWRDEVDSIRFASRPLGDLYRTFFLPGQNGPLYYTALRPWLELAGQSEFALRFFSLVFGTLAVPLVYRLGRRLFPSLPSLSLLAAFLTATSPYLIWYGQEGKMYAMVVVLILLSMDSYLAALEEGGWARWLLYVASTSAALYVHFITAFVIPAQALMFLMIGGERRRSRWKPWLASMAALTIPYLPLLRWQFPLLFETANTGYPFVPLPSMLLSLLASFGQGVVQDAAVWSAVFVGLALAAGLLWVDDSSHGPPLGILACWLLVPVLGFYLLTLIRPMYTARYLIFVVPAALLLLAAGVVAIARRSRVMAVGGLLVLVVVNGWGVWLQSRTPLKTDFRAVTWHVVGHMAADDLILFQIPYGRHSFDYYYQQSLRGTHRSTAATRVEGVQFRVFLPLMAAARGGSYRWAEGPFTNGGMGVSEVDRLMTAITDGSRVVWLVATEVPLWDDRGLTKAWLDQHARLDVEAHFTRVSAYRYELW
jgi:mannosyltransferase